MVITFDIILTSLTASFLLLILYTMIMLFPFNENSFWEFNSYLNKNKFSFYLSLIYIIILPFLILTNIMIYIFFFNFLTLIILGIIYKPDVSDKKLFKYMHKLSENNLLQIINTLLFSSLFLIYYIKKWKKTKPKKFNESEEEFNVRIKKKKRKIKLDKILKKL
jgi:hypothetical protein